jgi:hypothetical protein
MECDLIYKISPGPSFPKRGKEAKLTHSIKRRPGIVF